MTHSCLDPISKDSRYLTSATAHHDLGEFGFARKARYVGWKLLNRVVLTMCLNFEFENLRIFCKPIILKCD